MSVRRGLGKGLSELLTATLDNSEDLSESLIKDVVRKDIAAVDSAESNKNITTNLPINNIIPGVFQPRSKIYSTGIEQLAESIKMQGVLQPIVVRKKPNTRKYEIIAGERRWQAAKLVGMDTIPASILDVDFDSAMIIALVENIQRESLPPLDQALALKKIIAKKNLTQLQAAKMICKPRTSVTNLLRLLDLNSDVQGLLASNQIEVGHAKALLGLKGIMQTKIANDIKNKNLSVRETENLIANFNNMTNNKSGKKKSHNSNQTNSNKPDPNITALENKLAQTLGTQVTIKHSAANNKGLITIKYSNLDELDGILEHIN